MCKTSNRRGKAVKLGEHLIEMLDIIKQSETERGREITSYREAGELLATRIELAGGLKEVTQRNEA